MCYVLLIVLPAMDACQGSQRHFNVPSGLNHCKNHEIQAPYHSTLECNNTKLCFFSTALSKMVEDPLVYAFDTALLAAGYHSYLHETRTCMWSNLKTSAKQTLVLGLWFSADVNNICSHQKKCTVVQASSVYRLNIEYVKHVIIVTRLLASLCIRRAHG